MKAPYPRRPARVRFAASARDMPTYTLDEAEREVDRLAVEAEAARVRPPKTINAREIWSKYNKRT